MPSTYRHIGEAAPYYDDYVGSRHYDKGYVKVLWKPSRAVQARELTQMQTYAQNQIASLGGYLFKDGTVVQGGIISTTTKQKYFIGTVSYPAGMSLEDAMAGFMSNNKISSGNDGDTDRGLYATGLGDDGKIKFQIVGWTTLYDADGGLSLVSGTDTARGLTTTKIVVFYNILGGSFARKLEDGTIKVLENSGVGLTFSNPVSDVDSVLTVQSLLNVDDLGNPTSKTVADVYKTCTCAGCTQGTIFVDGYFVNCPLSYIMVNPIKLEGTAGSIMSTLHVKEIENDDVEYNIGFWIDRKIVDSYEDETLTDPAGGTYNHKAPGADRYSILAKLKCFSSDEINQMIEDGDNILQVQSTSDVVDGDGSTQGIKFAGGIVMKNNIIIKEQSNIGTNAALMDELARRTYEESGNYTVRPWKISVSESTRTNKDGVKVSVPSEYTISVGPGLGYVSGYRVSTCVSQSITNKKARETQMRTGNSKFTEDSMHVFSDDIYTLNDTNASPTRNVHSWHIEKVLAAERAYLVDRQISEKLTTYPNPQDLSVFSIANPATLPESKRITLDSLTAENEILGTCSIVDISSDGWHNLKISVLDVDGVANISDVSSIVSFDSVGVLSGYVDLMLDAENGNLTAWKNVEAPLIFELDWPFVAPDSNTRATFICNAFVSSENSIAVKTASNENMPGQIYVPFAAPTAIGSPATSRSVNFLVDESTGEIIPASKVVVDDKSVDTSFKILPVSDGILTEGHRYAISYQGDGEVVASKATSNDSSTQRTFKKKELTIGSMRLSSTELAALATAANDSEKGIDTIVVRDGYISSTEDQAVVAGTFVTDLVAILAIEEINDLNETSSTSTSNSESSTGTTTVDQNAPKELYWEVSNGMSSTIKVFDGCTDSKYEAASISGIGAWINAQMAASTQTDANGTQTTSGDTVPTNIKITYAYWKHSGSDGSFYYAGSYAVGTSASFSSVDNADTFKQRLAQVYGVDAIGMTRSVQSNEAYRYIPKYRSASGAWYDLTNCIDFRPDYDATVMAEQNKSWISIVPMPASRIQYDIATYLPRIDSVWIDKNGKFEITQGISSDNPLPPSEKPGTMVIYNIVNQPYGKTLNEVVLQYINNNRHTMVDINALAKRLSSLEEIVSLSMSEQSAANMQITDEDGLTRYKCGIFTDTFNGFGGCDFRDGDWKATIDAVEQCIRPDFEAEDWGFSPTGIYVNDGHAYRLQSLELVGTTQESLCAVYGQTQADAGSNAMTGGNILTIAPAKNINWKTEGCPSEYSWTYAKNDMATESTNLQAMMFVVWNGNLVLTPAIDTWVNDLGKIVTEHEKGDENANRPPDTFREWDITTYGTTQEKKERRTIPSGMTVSDLDALYGDKWRNIPMDQRLTHTVVDGKAGWWEPATTISDVTTYQTITTTTVTEKTTYIGDWQAVDTERSMERQDQFMRVRCVQFNLEGMRPNQIMRAKMDKTPLKLLTVAEFAKPNEEDRSYTDTITINDDGTYIGYFVVPENMPVGTKLVEFYDDEQTSTASADYTANGKTVWVDVDRNYIRTWTAQTSETMGESSTSLGEKIKTETISESTLIRHNGDPIAESFYIEEPNGITLESIQIYFATKDPTVGVEVFIVECENGFPGQTMVPFSQVFVPASKIALVTKEEFSGGNPTPTTFKFPAPLHLQGLKEYAFVVYAPSYNYEIYTSTLGKADFATGIGVKEQPYVGSMFKSQNLRTWTQEQLSDITFRMFKYQYDTGVPCKADFSLDDLVSINTGIPSSLPGTAHSGESSDEFKANSATISATTYTPTSTSIDFMWYTDSALSDAKPMVNKQSVFFDNVDGLSINNVMETKSEESNGTKIETNKNSSFKVRATLTTSDPNVAPQIDLEDFHGIFTKNAVECGEGKEVEIINGLKYYDAGTYISKTIALKNPAMGINVAVNAMLPNHSLIRAYLKTTAASRKSRAIWTPSLAENDYVLYNDIPNDNPVVERLLLPGYQESSWKEICNQRVYFWYYVMDAGNSEMKFILPNQELYGNNFASTYSHSSAIIKGASANTDEILPDSIQSTAETKVDTKAVKLVLKDPVNLDLLPNPTSYAIKSDLSATGGSRRAVVQYNSTDHTTSCQIYGVVAIPMTGPFTPNNIPRSVASDDPNADRPNYDGISCREYESDRAYANGEVCLFNGSIWMYDRENTTLDVGLEPANDAVYWKRIPCALVISSLQDDAVEDSQWVQLDVNDYTQTTERETNFMEYTYSLAPALELNEFDSYILKFRMLALNSRDIPRFRNLRAVAVY